MASVLKDYVTCPICYELFNGVEFEPQALQCLHTLCKRCLDQIATSPKFKCPQCKALCTRENTKSDFKTKSLVDDYMREHNRLQSRKDVMSSVPKCGMCDSSEKTLKSRCVDCQLYLCPGCEKAHKKIPALESHVIETLSIAMKHLEADIKKTVLQFEKTKQSIVQGKHLISAECGKLDKVEEEAIKKINKARKKQHKEVDTLHDGLIKQLEEEKKKALKNLTQEEMEVSTLLKEIQGKIGLLSQLLTKKDRNKLIVSGDITNKQVKAELPKLQSGAKNLVKQKGQFCVAVEEVKVPLNCCTKLAVTNKRPEDNSDETRTESIMHGQDVAHQNDPDSPADQEWDNTNMTIANKTVYATVVKRIDVLGTGRRLKIFDNELWCCTREALHVYSLDGELIRSVYWQIADEWASSIIPTPLGEDLIVSFYHSGVQLLSNDGWPIQTICQGEFSDIASFGNGAYALGWQEKKIAILECDGNRWHRSGLIQLSYEGNHSCDKLHVADEVIYVSSWLNNCIYTFTFQGDLLDTFPTHQHHNSLQLDGPKLCMVDHEDSALIADCGNGKFLWFSHTGQIVTIECPVNIGQPEDAEVQDENQSLWILTYDNGYKLLKLG